MELREWLDDLSWEQAVSLILGVPGILMGIGGILVLAGALDLIWLLLPGMVFTMMLAIVIMAEFEVSAIYVMPVGVCIVLFFYVLASLGG